MKHIITTGIITFFVFSKLSAQISFTDYSKNKMGAINGKGEIIIEPKFENLSDFFCNVAVVKENGICGLINSKGELLIPLEYESLEDYSEGLLAASKNGQYGFIDKNNKVIIPFSYDLVGSFHHGIAWVLNGQVYGFINKKGEEVTSIIYEDAIDCQENGVAYAIKGEKLYRIDSTGTILNTQTKPEEPWRKFGWNEGSIEELRPSYEKKMGYINRNGETIIQPKYYIAFTFHEGLAAVCESKEIGLGFINIKGEYVIKPNKDWQYIDGRTDFVNGLCEIKAIDWKKTNSHEKTKQKAKEDFDSKKITSEQYMAHQSAEFYNIVFINQKGDVVFSCGSYQSNSMSGLIKFEY